MRLLKASVGVVRRRAQRWRVSRSCGERVSPDFGRPLLATTRIIVRISGPRDRLATELATVLDRVAIKSGGSEADFVFENGQPTSGFEPLTRCLQIRRQLNFVAAKRAARLIHQGEAK
jgi:hypothetical protein